jgi:hypothetical protein
MAQVNQPLLSEYFKYKHLKYYSIQMKESLQDTAVQIT